MKYNFTITFAGKNFAALRTDQQEYVQHLMLSWRAVNNNLSFYDGRALKRAIRKALINRP